MKRSLQEWFIPQEYGFLIYIASWAIQSYPIGKELL